jgi:hypothetical protein
VVETEFPELASGRLPDGAIEATEDDVVEPPVVETVV